MWVNKDLFQRVLDDHKKVSDEKSAVWNTCYSLQAQIDSLRTQKAKDDITINWMRHRINALEKQNSILVAKTAGVHFPVPEIVPTRPGSISSDAVDFDHLPSFEDIGDLQATKLGIEHELDGTLLYKK